MGVNNRQRRKAKQDRRDRQQRAAGGRAFRPPAGERTAPGPQDATEAAREVVLAAALDAHRHGGAGARVLEAFLGACTRLGSPVVEDAFRYWQERALDAAWNGGWQPADVVRMVRRGRSTGHVQSIVHTVVESGRQRPEAAADRRWAAQLDGLVNDASEPGRSRWGLVERVEALGVLLHLPRVPRLVGSTSGRRARPGAGGASLERVRRLLAKAESTTFPEEAEALTTKAQELMARHAIDEAMLDASEATTSDLVAWRIGVDDPYAQAKSVLLGRIATANGSRMVWSKDLGFSTVFGTEPNELRAG